MKPLEKIDLIYSIALELQSRMTYNEIDIYLNEYGIKGRSENYGSKRVYVQKTLEGVPNDKIIKIGKELGVYKSEEDILDDDSRFWELGYFKMFISHLTTNKGSATNLKKCLKEYAISGFVAHEDIEPSKEWMQEIEKALFSMNGLCAIVVPDFIHSKWCDQEVGIAIGRKVLLVPIRKNADPYGFLGKYQGIQSKGKDANTISEEVFKIVSTNEKSKYAYIEVVKNMILNSKNSSEGIRWITLLRKIPRIELSYIEDIYSKFTPNDSLNDEKILNIANEIFREYGLSRIETKTFANKESNLNDDLPF